MYAVLTSSVETRYLLLISYVSSKLHHPFSIIISHSYPERAYRVFIPIVPHFSIEIPHHRRTRSAFSMLHYDLTSSLIETVHILYFLVLTWCTYLHHQHIYRNHHHIIKILSEIGSH